MTMWQVGTPEPDVPAIVYQDPDPSQVPAGSLNLVHNGTTAARSAYIDDIAVTDLAIVRAGWYDGFPWKPRPDIDRFKRTGRNFFTTSGNNSPMFSRGYIPDDTLIFGAPCLTKVLKKFRPECTAQSHAIRKLSDLIDGGFIPGRAPNDHVQWEVGPDNTNAGCPGSPDSSEETHDDCEPRNDPSSYRADILTARGEPGSASYGVVEVKRFSTSTPGDIVDQLTKYRGYLRNRGLNTDFDTTLNGIGWVVNYYDEAGNEWFAWAPTIAEEPINYRGIVYFDQASNTPQYVKDRWNSTRTFADRDYQNLRWYTLYVVTEYLLKRNPYAIPSPFVPVYCC